MAESADVCSGYEGPIIDAAVHYHWAAQTDVSAYMGSGWQEYLGRPGTLPGGGGMIPLLPQMPYHHPSGDKREDFLPADGSHAGSDPDLLVEHVFGDERVSRVVLHHDGAMLLPALPNPYLGREIIKAVNDWTVDRWLTGGDERLHGLVLVPNQLPESAAEEVLRVGGNERMVGVALGSNGLSKPFGHPLYHPIYAAAAEVGLPIVLHVDSDAQAETLSHPTAGGLPTSFSEYYVFTSQPVMTHLASLIVQGVFDRFPNLKLLIAGAGVGWIHSFFWRFDTEFKGLRRETPWMTRAPSEYFADHVRVTTNPWERAPTTEQLHRYLSSYEGLDRVMCFASGYPNWDTDAVDDVIEGLPDTWREHVMYGNADALFGWPGRRATPRVVDAPIGSMSGGRPASASVI